MTTGTAFGSLWLSSHPGTSSMGKLMALALLCTMAAAVLFQPALMGPPRQVPEDEPSPEPAAASPQVNSAAPAAWAVGRDPSRGPSSDRPPQARQEDEEISHKVEG